MTQPHYESWWDSLRHFGLLLSPTEVAKLENAYAPQDLPRWKADQLRRELTRFEAGDLARNDWVAVVLDNACGFDHEAGGIWQRGRNVSVNLSHKLITKENIKPTHVWSADNKMLPVFAVDVKHVGVGKGRKVVSDCVQWLRAAHQSLAVVTNGREWRLLYAGLDFDAGCEWSTDLWFEEGGPGAQLLALRTLLQPALFTQTNDDDSPLLSAVLASRRGQAELSSILGERVREAVELLVQSHRDALSDAALNDHGADIYRAAVRVVMRLVVVLFAESRELLPRSDPNYHGAYGLNSLFEQLQRLGARGRGRLGNRFSAWPRLLGLFRLIYKGSHHPSLQVPAYGGDLFAPGDPESDYALTRALRVFETGCFDSRYQLMPDAVVHQMLELLTRTEIRIRQGNKTMRTSMPVDFSDLSSEYIGILYEGLLDFELRTAAEDDPIVFLAVGNEPALPLTRLEAMSDSVIKKLFESLKDTSSSDATDDAEEAEVDADPEPESPDATDGQPAKEEADENQEELEAARARATAWTRHASLAAKLIKKPPASATPEKKQAFEAKLDDKARQLVRRIILPGDWYLVRWGGTRKGAGTFYTRPALAVPTVQRTLRPLAYNAPMGENGEADAHAPAEKWRPKQPEEILALKVCDPACGSGAFPVAALRFLTNALYESLYEHDRLQGDWGRPLPEILCLDLGEGYDSRRSARLPCPPESEGFETRTKAVLRRYVVEHCIYGVDIDPLASELCRLALWIETMDRDLPFSFLDHKIRCGNSLVGTWFDQFQHYPAMAWMRNAGDEKHVNGVNFSKGEKEQIVKAHREKVIKPDLEASLAGDDLFVDAGTEKLVSLRKEIADAFEFLHRIPISDSVGRAEAFRGEQLAGSHYSNLKSAMDLWCSCWFWPADELASAPLPSELNSPSEETKAVVKKIAAKNRFFHWELEFPDVFLGDERGFDSFIGNPPWEILKPNLEEFFSNIDPLFRTYESALQRRILKDYFEQDPNVEQLWLAKLESQAAASNYFAHASCPYGDPKSDDKPFSIVKSSQKNKALHDRWRTARSLGRELGSSPPYTRQGGGDLNTYKLFTELIMWLSSDSARMGVVIPAGIYSDFYTRDLRVAIFSTWSCEWVFSFENKQKLFPIDSTRRFCVLISSRKPFSSVLNLSFGQVSFESWSRSNPEAMSLPTELLTKFSPYSGCLIEVETEREFEALKNIYGQNYCLGDEKSGWDVSYQTEFHMRSARGLFETVESLPDGMVWDDARSAWDVVGGSDGYTSLYTGKMIYQYDYNYQKWISGHGNTATWEKQGFDEKVFAPEYVLPIGNAKSRWSGGTRLAFRDMAKSSNEVSMIAAVIPAWPCGNKVPFLYEQNEPIATKLALCSVLNSYVFNFIIRSRLTGINLNKFIVYEIAVPPKDKIEKSVIIAAARLSLAGDVFAEAWLELAEQYPEIRNYCWKDLPAIEEADRRELREYIEAKIAKAYGLDSDKMKALPDYMAGEFSIIVDPDPSRSKGLWRVDKTLPQDQRSTQRSLFSYVRLRTKELNFDPLQTAKLPESQEKLELSWAQCREKSNTYRNAWPLPDEEGVIPLSEQGTLI